MMKNTSAILLVDGFGGMAITDSSKLDKDVVQHLNEESVWEVFDGIEKLEAGKYSVHLNFWWESNFPESGNELIIEVDKSELISA